MNTVMRALAQGFLGVSMLVTGLSDFSAFETILLATLQMGFVGLIATGGEA